MHAMKTKKQEQTTTLPVTQSLSTVTKTSVHVIHHRRSTSSIRSAVVPTVQTKYVTVCTDEAVRGEDDRNSEEEGDEVEDDASSTAPSISFPIRRPSAQFTVATSAIPTVSSHSYYPTLTFCRTHALVFISLLLSLIIFSNSLHGEFSFDDHSTLVENPDTNPSNSFLPIFFHDSLGETLVSHPYYQTKERSGFRPFTIWSWRCTRSVIQLIMGPAAVQSSAGKSDGNIKQQQSSSTLRRFFIALATPPHSGSAHSSSSSSSSSNSDSSSVLLAHSWYPFLFHFQNLLLHLACTFLVYTTAFHIFNLRVTRDESDCNKKEEPKSAASTPESTTSPSAKPPSPLPPATAASSSSPSSPIDTAPPSSLSFPVDLFRRRAIFLSFLTSLFFAVHPIHTDAVSSVVGHSELLCCFYMLVAFQLWWWSNLLLTSTGEAKGISVGIRAFCTNLSLVCFLAATLSKETGFTLFCIFLLVDAVHAAMILCIGGIALTPYRVHSNTADKPRRGSGSSSTSAPIIPTSTWLLHFISLLWPRFLLLFICSSFYLFWRRLLAGATFAAATVFRSTENPIAVESSLMTRLLTHFMAHGKYAQLLVAPWNLCCDYSINCLPVVTSIFDLRWLPGVVVYAAIFLTFFFSLIQVCRILNTKRIETMRLIATQQGYTIPPISSNQPTKPTRSAMLNKFICQLDGIASTPFSSVDWHLNLSLYSSLLFSLSFLVLPFLPSSNIFFYVGSLVSERVLYIPSIGACMLLALLLERALFHGMEWTELQAGEVDAEPTATTAASSSTSTSPFIRTMHRIDRNRIFLCVCAALLLVLYFSLLTYTRNHDWTNESTLFESAYAVCPTNVKILMNYGILHRRNLEYSSALTLFHRISKIDPLFCDHFYWISLTKINIGNIQIGINLLKKSLSCVYTRNEALTILHMLFEQILQKDGILPISKETFSSPSFVMPSLASLAPRSESEILGEWSEIMHLVDQAETSTKYAVHAGTLAFSTHNYTYALELFENAFSYSRDFIYDRNQRLINYPTTQIGPVNDFLSSSRIEGELVDLEVEAFDPLYPSDEEPPLRSAIFTSNNQRCAAAYWLARTHLTMGHFLIGSRLLRSLIQSSTPSILRNNCIDFKLHALDHMAEFAQKKIKEIDQGKKTTEALLEGITSIAALKSEAHSFLAFVLIHLGKNTTSAQHYHAAAYLLEGKTVQQEEAADEKASSDLSSSSPSSSSSSSIARASPSDRLQAIEYYRMAIELDPELERATYGLAIALIETAQDVEEGQFTGITKHSTWLNDFLFPASSHFFVSFLCVLLASLYSAPVGILLLRSTLLSADAAVRSSSLNALEILQSAYGPEFGLDGPDERPSNARKQRGSSSSSSKGDSRKRG